LGFSVDPNGAVPDFDGIRSHADVGNIEANAVFKLKLPLVPGAGDITLTGHAIMQGRTPMRTDVINGKKTFLAVKNADLEIAKGDAAAFADGDFFELEGSIEVGHGK